MRMSRVLFQSACVVVSMTSDHLHIKALNAPIDDDTIEALLKKTEELLDGTASFKTTWDLRECQSPSVGQAARCLRWALANKNRLNDKNQRLAIVHRETSTMLQKVITSVLRRFGPSCPMWLGASPQEADAFMLT
jgi:hypothetical protein